MPNLVNKLVAEELEREFEGAEGMLIVSFAGLTVEESEALRNALAAKGVRFRMVRNKLARQTLEKLGKAFASDVFIGNTAIAYGDSEHAIAAAKILTDKDVKKAGKVTVKAGLLEGSVLSKQDAQSLADVPDRDTLNAQLLGVINGPARSIATLLCAPQGALVRVLQARADKLASAGS
jgi:large subunit ribosomal protein L10